MPDRSTISDSRRSGDREPLDIEEVPDVVWHTPTFAFMKPRLSRWIALGFGSGLAPVAPGTVGTLFAWAVFVLLDPWIPAVAWWGLILVGFVVGCWACDRTGRDLGVPDHSGIVWDEVIAFWAVLVLVPATAVSQVAAFFVFRIFDVVKPPPIRQFDRSMKNGFGVMFDDVLAAFYTVLVFAAWSAWVR